MAVAASETTWSKFLHSSRTIAEEVEDHDVILTRRGRASLRLSLASREAETFEGLAVAARFLQRLLRLKVVSQLIEEGDSFVGWLDFLPEADRAAFVEEFSRTALACAEVGELAPLGQLVHEWKATAAIHAAPGLAEKLRRPLAGDGERVPEPTA